MVLRSLLLCGNEIRDSSTLERVVANGALFEVHIPDNKLTQTSAIRLVLAAAAAKTLKGRDLYPLCGTRPLWLSIEGNAVGNLKEFATRLADHLGRLGALPRRLLCGLGCSLHPVEAPLWAHPGCAPHHR